MAGAAAPQRFSWPQFRVMLRVIVRGEQHLDSTGMGLGDDGTPRKGFWGGLGVGVRRVAMGLVFLLLAALFFMMGYLLGEAGVTPYVAFSLCVVCLVGLTVLTGLYQAVNILYFVRDLGYYLTLPVSATTVMWAKLTHFLGMSLLGDLIILPVGLGCLLANGAAPLTWVAMTIAFALSAIAVDLALVIVCVPLMRFSRLAHDKDLFSRFFGGLIIVLALVIGVGSQFALRGDGLASLAAGSERLLSGGVPAVAMGLLCPPSLLARPVVEGDALGALAGLLAMLVSVVVYALVLSAVARRWYFEGVQALQGAGGRRGRRVEGAELARATRTRGALAANLSRDWKTMARVPVFFNQFVLSSLLMPLYFVAIMVVSGFVGFSQASEAGIEPMDLLEMARSLTALLTFDSPALAWCAVGVLVFGLFLGFSSYSFTMGVSRDGEDFFFLRGLPMDWSAYLASKFVVPFALSTVPMLVLIVVALVVLGVPAAAGLYLVGIYLGATITLGLLSLGLGALFPRLTWDNETQLVKGGGATLMVFAGLVVGVVVMALPALALLAGVLWEVLTVPVALALALGLFVAECAALVWWVLGPCARSLSRRER
ncbi:putative ABC transporter permease subunit [Thermophilibacter sp.]|uniref:putative ABC transporter permease subunit n=1 Tax=Thermophilibacter sp. TaxID=2847309 RepID=UPI003A925A34